MLIYVQLFGIFVFFGKIVHIIHNKFLIKIKYIDDILFHLFVFTIIDE